MKVYGLFPRCPLGPFSKRVAFLGVYCQIGSSMKEFCEEEMAFGEIRHTSYTKVSYESYSKAPKIYEKISMKTLLN